MPPKLTCAAHSPRLPYLFPALLCPASSLSSGRGREARRRGGSLFISHQALSFWGHYFCLFSTATLPGAPAALFPPRPAGPGLPMASHCCWPLGLHYPSSVPSTCPCCCDRFLTTLFSDPLGVYRLCPLHHV